MLAAAETGSSHVSIASGKTNLISSNVEGNVEVHGNDAVDTGPLVMEMPTYRCVMRVYACKEPNIKAHEEEGLDTLSCTTPPYETHFWRNCEWPESWAKRTTSLASRKDVMRASASVCSVYSVVIHLLAKKHWHTG